MHAFAEAAPGKTLSLLAWHYYKQAGLIDAFGLDPEKLYRYLSKIETGYNAANPYHNRYAMTSTLHSQHGGGGCFLHSYALIIVIHLDKVLVDTIEVHLL